MGGPRLGAGRGYPVLSFGRARSSLKIPLICGHAPVPAFSTPTASERPGPVTPPPPQSSRERGNSTAVRPKNCHRNGLPMRLCARRGLVRSAVRRSRLSVPGAAIAGARRASVAYFLPEKAIAPVDSPILTTAVRRPDLPRVVHPRERSGRRHSAPSVANDMRQT
jgi:hypothetical protein